MWWLIAVWLIAISWSTCGWAGAAEDCQQENDLDRSISGCTELINAGKENYQTYTWRGSAYIQKGDYDRAIADLTKAIDLDPKYAKAYFGRGYAHNQKGDYD